MPRPFGYDIKRYIASTSETDDFKSLMQQSFLPDHSERVGIFWYSEVRKELFGVSTANPYETNDPNLSIACLPNSRKTAYTCRILHKQLWKKEFNKHKFHPSDEINLFIGDYKDKPRGRIFYIPQEHLFQICVGDWFYKNEDALDLIVETFGLLDSDYEVVLSTHWDIGNGWENE